MRERESEVVCLFSIECIVWLFGSCYGFSLGLCIWFSVVLGFSLGLCIYLSLGFRVWSRRIPPLYSQTPFPSFPFPPFLFFRVDRYLRWIRLGLARVGWVYTYSGILILTLLVRVPIPSSHQFRSDQTKPSHPSSSSPSA